MLSQAGRNKDMEEGDQLCLWLRVCVCVCCSACAHARASVTKWLQLSTPNLVHMVAISQAKNMRSKRVNHTVSEVYCCGSVLLLLRLHN